MNPIDYTVRVFSEAGICHESIVLSVVFVVNRHDDRIIVFVELEQVEASQEVHVKFALAKVYLLVESNAEFDLLEVVFLIRRIEHNRHIVKVFLLLHTAIDPDISTAIAIDFESKLQLLVSCDILECKQWDLLFLLFACRASIGVRRRACLRRVGSCADRRHSRCECLASVGMDQKTAVRARAAGAFIAITAAVTGIAAAVAGIVAIAAGTEAELAIVAAGSPNSINASSQASIASVAVGWARFP